MFLSVHVFPPRDRPEVRSEQCLKLPPCPQARLSRIIQFEEDFEADGGEYCASMKMRYHYKAINLDYELPLSSAGFGSTRLEPPRELIFENGWQPLTGTWRVLPRDCCSIGTTPDHRMP